MMNADTLTMLCREGDVEANDSFQRQFSPSCNFQNVVWKFVDSARSLVRNSFFLEHWCLSVLRTLPLSLSLALSLSLSHMYRGWWASFSAQCCCRGWARSFQPTSEHLESTSMFPMLIQQQSEPSVEDWNMLTTIRSIGPRAKSVVG